MPLLVVFHQQILESLNCQSFFVQDMVNDLGYTCLRDVSSQGNKMIISFYDITQKRR